MVAANGMVKIRCGGIVEGANREVEYAEIRLVGHNLLVGCRGHKRLIHFGGRHKLVVAHVALVHGP